MSDSYTQYTTIQSLQYFTIDAKCNGLWTGTELEIIITAAQQKWKICWKMRKNQLAKTIQNKMQCDMMMCVCERPSIIVHFINQHIHVAKALKLVHIKTKNENWFNAHRDLCTCFPLTCSEVGKRCIQCARNMKAWLIRMWSMFSSLQAFTVRNVSIDGTIAE